MNCKICKDTGWTTISVPTDYGTGASYKEDVPCHGCDKGAEEFKKEFG